MRAGAGAGAVVVATCARAKDEATTVRAEAKARAGAGVGARGGGATLVAEALVEASGANANEGEGAKNCAVGLLKLSDKFSVPANLWSLSIDADAEPASGSVCRFSTGPERLSSMRQSCGLLVRLRPGRVVQLTSMGGWTKLSGESKTASEAGAKEGTNTSLADSWKDCASRAGMNQS